MARIVDPLRELGVPIEAAAGRTAPLVISARPSGVSLRGRSFSLPVASAQVKTALLLAGLGADGIMEITEPGPSRDHSERLLREMGVKIEVELDQYRIRLTPPRSPMRPLELTLPGDISSAAFLVCAALIVPGSEITLLDVGLNPTRTGLLDALLEMGARIEIAPHVGTGNEPRGDIQIRSSALNGIEIRGSQVVRMIDEFPIFAVAAALAHGETLVREARELRHKESDRISTLCAELQALGVEIEELPDGFRIQGQLRLSGGAVVNGHGDHRLAMAECVAGLAAKEEVVVEGAEIIAQSYPTFVDQLAGLGGRILA
jgi:3-phosphoshikimate 1-carboxyvinyltransferase